jgi:long-chain acyl-CoA synthetase
MSQGLKRPDEVAFAEKQNGSWVNTNWKGYRDQVRQATKALIAAGFQSGDTACILGFNRPEWVVMDLAAMTAGGAPAGIYTTCSSVEVAYILNHSAAKVVLLQDAGQWAKVESKLEELPALQRVVMMRGAPAIVHEKVQSWDQFLKSGEGVPEEEVDNRLATLKPEALATLIYTSGTTGPPKAVMLSHHNLSWTADRALGLVSMSSSDVSLSYLPLSHIAEQMFTIHAPITAGSIVYYAESMEKLKDNLAEARPTVMFGVPRVWEKFHAALNAKFREATGIKAVLLGWARGVGAEVDALRAKGQEPGGWLGIKYKLANKLVFSKMKAALGLDRAKTLVSGAAPIAKDVLEFFSSIDLPVCEVYGQSEGSGPTTFNLLNKRKAGTVGTDIPGIQVKLAEDGEILVSGPNIFMGYYKDAAATDETLKDGWLLSGDLGAFDGERFLSIVGRKKEIIITAGGKNIAPKNIEAALKQNPLIGEAVVVGDRRPYLIALLTLEPGAAEKFAADHKLSGAIHESDALQAELKSWVAKVNEQFAQVEHVRRWLVLPRVLTEADGELTPTMKLKRKKIQSNWVDQIESVYAQEK